MDERHYKAMNEDGRNETPTIGNDANRLLPAIIFDEVIKTEEYKKYCKVYKVVEPTKEKEVGMYLIWKSFGCSL